MNFITIALIAIVAFIALNAITNNYLWDSIMGTSSLLITDAICFAGIIMAYPLWMGMPIVPTADDLALAVMITIGILWLVKFKRPLTKLMVVLVFLGVWLALKIGTYLIVLSLGCIAALDVISEVTEPIAIAMWIILPLVLLTLYLKYKDKLKEK